MELGISLWGAGAVLIVAGAVVSAALQPDDDAPTQVQSSGPCDQTVKQGTIKGMAVRATGWTTPLSVAHDQEGYWLNPAGAADGPSSKTSRVCVLRGAERYEAWMQPSDAAGSRESNWISVTMHPEGQK